MAFCNRVLASLIGFIVLGLFPAFSSLSDKAAIDLEVFVREGCPHCAAAKVFLRQLQTEHPQLQIAIRDVGEDAEALAKFQSLASRFGIAAVGVPAFYLRDQLLVGFVDAETTGRRIRELLDMPLTSPQTDLAPGSCPPETSISCGKQTQLPPSVADGISTRWFGRLTVRNLGLPLFTLALGLLDGFNPCAMWVLLFLLSLLVNLHDRMRMALVAGTFVLVSGLVYFAFMAAWLNIFLLIGLSRTVQVMLGGVAAGIGALNVKDFFAFRKGISVEIPRAAKPAISSHIRGILQADNLPGALIGIIALAVLVNAVELLCTAGFPALYTQILTLHQLSWWQYYGYLGLYNLAYILDDGLMVTIAVVTLGHHKLQEREGRWLKLVSGVVMVGLGGLLLLKPEWLVD